MDPVTAALQALRAFNDFLSTPAGQKLADLNTELIQTVFTKLHIRVLPDSPAAPKVA